MPSASEPASLEEASELLSSASRAGERISIERSGGDRVISTQRLNRLIEHEPGDLTCIVEAGLRLSELQELLRPAGQALMLDPPGDPTVGACLAGNLSGPRSHRFGAPRDLVLGVTVVLADGTVASSGGRVVKNVAGYDLGKLFCGSRGRLGLIARVALRLHALPSSSVWASAAAADAVETERLARLLRGSPLALSALDVAWPGRLAVLFEGSERVVAAQLEAARELVECEPDPGVEDDLRRQQATAERRISFDPGALAAFLTETPRALVRVAAGQAYVTGEGHREWTALAERVRAQLDPAGVLAA